MERYIKPTFNELRDLVAEHSQIRVGEGGLVAAMLAMDNYNTYEALLHEAYRCVEAEAGYILEPSVHDGRGEVIVKDGDGNVVNTYDYANEMMGMSGVLSNANPIAFERHVEGLYKRAAETIRLLAETGDFIPHS